MLNAVSDLLTAFLTATFVVGFIAATIFTTVVTWSVLRYNSLPWDLSSGYSRSKPPHDGTELGTLTPTQRHRILSRFVPGMSLVVVSLLTFSTLVGAPASREAYEHLKPSITVAPKPVLSAAQLATIVRASAVKHVTKFSGRASRNANNRRDEWLRSDRTIKPGSHREYAVLAMAKYDWNTYQWSCLDRLWWHESGWSPTGGHPKHAYGIPQAYPGKKMAIEGKDWEENPETQIDWGLRYIDDRYDTPCKAFAAWSKRASRGYGWY